MRENERERKRPIERGWGWKGKMSVSKSSCASYEFLSSGGGAMRANLRSRATSGAVVRVKWIEGGEPYEEGRLRGREERRGGVLRGGSEKEADRERERYIYIERERTGRYQQFFVLEHRAAVRTHETFAQLPASLSSHPVQTCGKLREFTEVEHERRALRPIQHLGRPETETETGVPVKCDGDKEASPSRLICLEQGREISTA